MALSTKIVLDQTVTPFRDMAGLFDAPTQLLEMLPIAVYACDGQGLLKWFNGRAAELWGRAPRIGDDTEKFCGSFKLYGLDGTTIAREETPMAHVLRTGEAVHGKEAEVERPDGTRVIAMVHIDPVKDAEGNLIGAINCFHETTELHKTKKRLAEGSEIFRQLLQALPVAIYMTDAQGKITFYNEAAAELAGQKPKLREDEWCVTWRLFSPDGEALAHDECPMATALRENRPVRGVEALAERPDGSRVPFLPFPTPLRDLSGKLVGAVNMLVDISEQKAAEARQRILFDELNHRVKNNMQMLHSLLKIAERETHSTEAQSVLSDAAKRVGAMATAQQVLYYADGSVEFDARSFVDMLCQNARQTFGNLIDISYVADSHTIPNDAAVPLSLILNELLTNAVKYGSAGRDRVGVKIALMKKDDMWKLSVEDDGPGFVFSEAAKRSSGLGLVTGLAHQLGGNLTVGNGKGALCIVSFPARAACLH